MDGVSDMSGAIFSPCEKYRYRLWRTWAPERPRLVYVMLNPSTADAEKNDPTITRCMKRARLMGYGGIEALNIFAWRSTDPRGLYSAEDPVGPDNDSHIKAVCDAAIENWSKIILGWGEHGCYMSRGRAVRKMLDDKQIDTYALRLNASGEPQHPLYIEYKAEPIHISPWARERAESP